MKKNINVVLILLLIFCIPKVNAQSFIAPEILEKYSPSVYSRVYEITLSTLIPHEKQLEFANFFVKKDSLLLAATKQGKSIKYNKELLDSLQVVFDKTFSSEYLSKYNNAKYKNYLDADAKMYAAYFKNRYNTEGDIETSFYKVNLIKNQKVLKALSSNASLTNLADSNKLFFKQYDSIMGKYIVAAEGEKYFKDKIFELNKIKPISTKDINELRKNYQSFCLKNGSNFHKNFNSAMQFVISDSFYYKFVFQDSINHVANKLAKDELESYVYKYNLDLLTKNKIAPIIAEKAKRTVWLDTRYMFNRKRDSLQTEINEISWAKIKNQLIRIGFTRLGKSRFTDAIKYQRVLNLSDMQLDSLSEANLKIDLLNYQYAAENNGATNDFSFYTDILLQGILTEGQYDTLLKFIVTPQALASAKQNWEQIIKHKLANNSDSATNIKPIIGYHIERLLLWERYSYKPNIYNKLININRQNKPDILKRLDEAKKEETIEGEKIKTVW